MQIMITVFKFQNLYDYVQKSISTSHEILKNGLMKNYDKIDDEINT